MEKNPNPIVTTKHGQLRGKLLVNNDGEQFYSFQGIPYAKPPIGQLRFSAPEPAEPWSGIYDATKEGPECPSMHVLLPKIIGNEDNCLNLNVYTKHLPEEKKVLLPVMFYIHGGGFNQGSNKTVLYGPDFLMTKDIVLVVINYRLGPLGFLCLEDSSLGVPGNAGIKDQIMALKWVQENIKYFGGDPDNVTIFGVSAGGASVHYLVLSSRTKGLFHRAIMQSGCALNAWAEGSRGAENLCGALGFHEKDEKKMLEYLRSIPSRCFPEALRKMRNSITTGERRLYGPVIEKPSLEAVLTDTPDNIIKSGVYNKVPMILGCTDMEGYIYELYRKIPPYGDFPIKDLCKEVDRRHVLPEDPLKRENVLKKIKKFYFGNESSDMNDVENTLKLKGDNVFVYDIVRAAKLHKESSNQPIYMYVMTIDTKLNVCKSMYTAYWFRTCSVLTLLATKLSDGLLRSTVCYLREILSKGNRNLKGVAHGDDVMYLFKSDLHHPLVKNSVEDIAIKKIVTLWTNFAACGNPTPDNSDNMLGVIWNPVDDDISYLNLGNEFKMEKQPFHERIKFWDDIFNELPTLEKPLETITSDLKK